MATVLLELGFTVIWPQPLTLQAGSPDHPVPTRRDGLNELANMLGVEFRVMECTASEDLVHERLQQGVVTSSHRVGRESSWASAIVLLYFIRYKPK